MYAPFKIGLNNISKIDSEKKTFSRIRFTNMLFNSYIYLCRICLIHITFPRALYANMRRNKALLFLFYIELIH